MTREERLYNLLPAIYRIRDAEEGEPLRALLGILEEQSGTLEDDIAGLYDDWFIETSAEWVVPYIGDLLGVRLLSNVESAGVYSQRALVANTLSLRRRKGTLEMLEDLARDVTGWPAHAVAFFENLGWTQNLNHLRYDLPANPHPRSPDRLNPPAVNRVGTVNLRSLDVVDRTDGPFDVLAHSADVRVPRQSEGWHNIRNLGIFLWRLGSYPMRGVEPRRSDSYPDGFHFSPLGNPAPLFTNPARKGQGQASVTETNVPGPVRPLALFEQPEAYYGSGSDMSLALYEGPLADPDRLIPIEKILCKDLRDWSPPPLGSRMVAVDVRLGRFAFAPGETPDDGVTASYHYGFSADIGGGPYDRRTTIRQAATDDWAVTVAKAQPDPPPGEWRTTIAAAIADWNPAVHPHAVITIADNRTYEETLSVELAAGQFLTIQAGNFNRPALRLRDGMGALSVLTIGGGNGEDAALTLNGLLIEGGIAIENDSLGALELVHCTLVPGRALDEDGRPALPAAASLTVAQDNPGLEITIRSSIMGGLRLPRDMTGLVLRDSIVDRPQDDAAPDALRAALAEDDAGDDPGPPTSIERTTVFGTVDVKMLTLASETVFTQRVRAQRRQAGCLRYSYLDDVTSITPRRFRCQPDLALELRRRRLGVDALPAIEAEQIRARLRPAVTSAQYGHPGYAQLSLATAEEVRAGAEDGAEMGAFEGLKQPQREANLRIRLEEYMPYGLAAARVYVT